MKNSSGIYAGWQSKVKRQWPPWVRLISGGIQWHIVAAVFLFFVPREWPLILGVALVIVAFMAVLIKRTRVEGMGFVLLGPLSAAAINTVFGIAPSGWPIWLPYWP